MTTKIVQSLLDQVLKEMQEELSSSHKLSLLSKAFERISKRYREETGLFLQTEEERLSYLFTRLPATFAVACRVFQELKRRVPDLEIHSLLDVGAGPGTGMWAAVEEFKTLHRGTFIEKDFSFASIGKQLIARSSHPVLQQAPWHSMDMKDISNIKSHDLTLLSYSIGEVNEEHWESILSTLWQITEKALVIIEPGTPSGYRRMMKIRDFLHNQLGAYLVAPCPHSKACPLSKEDWCHFSERVQRSSLHRYLKSADLGYEDEKFCYLILGKQQACSFSKRIIRHPMKHSGFIEVTVCEKEGTVQKKIYSKKNKEMYKEIKKLNWGDLIP